MMQNGALRRSRPRVRQKRVAARFLGIVWGAVGLILALVAYSPTQWQATVGVLMLTQAFAAMWAWPRLRASANAVLPDFLTIFLLFQVVNKTLTALNLIVRAAGVKVATIAVRFDLLTDSTNFYRWQAEWVFFAGTVFFTLGWLFFERRRPLFVWVEPPPRLMWWVFGLCILFYLGMAAVGVAVSSGMMSGLFRLFALGALAVLLGGQSQYALGRRYVWVPLLMLVPFFVVALRSGVKGEFALVAMPILLPIIRRLTLARFVALLGFVLVVVLVVFPFSFEARRANWQSWGGAEDAGVVELASRVSTRWETDGVVTSALEGAKKWLARGSTADIGGLVMQIADRDGHIGGVLIEGLAYIFVPRFLWAEKPKFAPGAWFTWYLGRASSPETASSATAMMLGTEMYWMYGWWGVLIGMALLGLLYAWCWRQLIHMSISSLVPLVALFAFVIRAAGLESTHSLYAIAEPITFLVYVYGFRWVERRVVPRWPKLATRER